MKIFNKQSVYDAAIDRINFLFDEFPNIVVCFSGGKDSTVMLNLALNIAEERERLPLRVLFIDQEAEWQGTIDYVEKVMTDPRVDPMWMQIPMFITNNASSYDRYSFCWDPETPENWIREKHPVSIKENIYGTKRFHALFDHIIKVEYKDQKCCFLSGVRADEAPKRFTSLTTTASYKYITYGKVVDKKTEHYTFYPLYDWANSDIWKFIHDNKLLYNKIYDRMYNMRVPLNDMRISNLHHETSVQSLLLVQEIEPETWNKIADRITGAGSIKHIKSNSYHSVDELPYMFKDWEEYSYYLIENIIQEDKNKTALLEIIEKDLQVYDNEKIRDSYFKRAIVPTVLTSDWDYTKIANYKSSHEGLNYRMYKTKNQVHIRMLTYKRFFSSEQLSDIITQLNTQKQ
jgi:predicted phosphoadenosine phosphosulfate sulfurtransferase